jgi:putative FmdB family regulatory protein
MPLYEYRCLKCEHVVEVLQKLSDRPLRKCELCSGKLEKLISRTSFQLKGGGWFAHGYGSSKSSGGSAAKEPSGDKDDSKSPKKDGGGPKKKKPKATE